MQPIRIPTSLHDPPGLFVYNFDFIFHHYILHVFFEEGVGFEQLIKGVYAFSFDIKITKECFFFFGFFFGLQLFAFNLGQCRTDIGQYKKVFVFFIARKAFDAFFGQFDLIGFLVDDKKEFLVDDMHFPVVVLHVVIFGLLQQLLDALFTQKFDERFVFGKSPIDA